MINVLNQIAKQLQAVGINYEFGRMTQHPPKYPYWVGEYSEPEPLTEDGLLSPSIILSGFARGSRLSLEQDKQRIRNYFIHGQLCTTDQGTILLSYGGSLDIPDETADLYRCQITIAAKEWRII